MSTRRDFLKGMGLATAGMTLNPGGMFAMTSKETQQAKSEKVKIYKVKMCCLSCWVLMPLGSI